MKEQNVTQALKHVESNMDKTAERDYIVDFIRNSERGIVRGYNGV